MKTLIHQLIHIQLTLKTSILAVIAFFIFSCENEEYLRGFMETNQPPTNDETVQSTDDVETDQFPIAVAGSDQAFSLPKDSTLLDGSASRDLEGIIGYDWKKIEGPDSISIINPTSAKTMIKGLVEGIYHFELKVTNTSGLIAMDSMKVGVFPPPNPPPPPATCNYGNWPEVSAQLIEIGTFPQVRYGMAVISSGNKIFFAGGTDRTGSNNSSRIDIYNITSQSWTTAELSVARHSIAAVANNNKIFFAGGEIGDGTWPVDDVDIYDAYTDTWKSAHLSLAGSDIKATAVGNKVLFVGGDGGFSGGNRHSRVDIFDDSSGEWTTALLSEYKVRGHEAVTINDKAYFAGGEDWVIENGHGSWFCSDKIDVYDNTTNTWSVETMYEGKMSFAGIAVSDRIYWAGGITGYSQNTQTSSIVEIWDTTTGNSTIECLHQAGSYRAVQQDGKIVFFTSSSQTSSTYFDVYDVASNSWHYGILPVYLTWPEIISINNVIYVAGGYSNGELSDKIYVLEF